VTDLHTPAPDGRRASPPDRVEPAGGSGPAPAPPAPDLRKPAGRRASPAEPGEPPEAETPADADRVADRPAEGAAGEADDVRADAVPVKAAGERPRRDFAWLAIPLSIFAATRIVQLMIIAWMAPADSTVRSRLLIWDSTWFQRVAEEGYPHEYTYNSEGTMVGNGLAFFPGYPALIRLVHDGLGVDYAAGSLIVAWVAAAVAAVLVQALGTAMYDRRVGTALTALFCTQPMSVVLSMGYSEALFVALVAGGLLAAYRERWVLAGLLGLAGGLTRATGAALGVAIAVAALIHVVRHRPAVGRGRALLGGALALAGVPAWVGFAAWRVGDLNAWFNIQTAGWGTTFDYGYSVFYFVHDALRGGDGWMQNSVAFLVIGVVLAAFLAIRMGTWPPLLVYGLIALTLVLGQAGYYHSKPRLLVPVLVTLVPAAVALGRIRPRAAAGVLVAFGLFGMWYGAYVITVWRYAI
jgi:hypothetical protein